MVTTVEFEETVVGCGLGLSGGIGWFRKFGLWDGGDEEDRLEGVPEVELDRGVVLVINNWIYDCR
jgi:hypothetical protein